MKQLLILGGALLAPLCHAAEPPDLSSDAAKINYSVGYQIGSDFRAQEIKINPEVLVRGIQDAIAGEKALMTADEQRAALVSLQRQVDAQQKQNDAKKGQE